MHPVNIKGNTFLYISSDIVCQAFIKYSCLLHSSMYQVVSITTIPEPLSAGSIIMSLRSLSERMACRSVGVRLSRIVLGLQVVMSSLTALRKVSRARSRSYGGVPSAFVLERGVIFVSVGVVTVLVEKIFS